MGNFNLTDKPLPVAGYGKNEFIQIMNAVRSAGLYFGKYVALGFGIDSEIVFEGERLVLQMQLSKNTMIQFGIEGIPELIPS